MKKNLVYKLFATYLLLALVAILTVNVYLGGHIKVHLKEKIEQDLLTYAKLINVTASMEEMESAARHIAETAGTRVTLIDKRGFVLADTESSPSEMENHFDRPEIQESRVRGAGQATRLSATLGIETLYVAVAIGDESKTVGYIRLAKPLTEVKDSMNALNLALFQSFLLIGAISFLVAFVFSQRLVSPIQEMEEFTTKLQKGEFPGKLLISAADERGRLARNINYLVNELREKIDWATEEKSKLEAAFSSMTDSVFILDDDGVIEVYNDSFKSMFPAGHGDVIGKTPLDAFRNVDLQDTLERFNENKQILSREITIGNGDPRVMEVTLCPIRGLPAHETKTMIVFHDVTRVKKLEKMRADFVANVTHEIKTPLTAILGCIETLSRGAIDNRDTALHFLDVIGRHAERLNRLVDDLLTISDLELGELPLSIEDLPLESVLTVLWPLIESQALKKNVHLAKDVPSELLPLRGDKDRVVQVLLNVLDNAVKFTDSGGSVSLTARHAGQDTLEIKISDTGIGIPKSDLSRLGERFYRVDRARSRQSGGTGLGLSIVKHLMAAHGGRVDITSRPGGGTDVRLFFPLAKNNV
ncbi:MAG: ATP-binding protein [Syntrophales bacterium]|nr:ATP-binding protein [Syntrophales bacterium]